VLQRVVVGASRYEVATLVRTGSDVTLALAIKAVDGVIMASDSRGTIGDREG